MAGSPIKKARHIAKLREIGLDAVLELVEEGMLYRDIAEKLGVSQGAVSAFLYLDENNTGDNVGRLAAARKVGARAHVEIALTDAQEETDPRMAGLQKLRADMRLHLARADDHETWGEKKNLQVNGALDVRQLHLVAVSRSTVTLPKMHTTSLPARPAAALAGSVEHVITEVELEEHNDGEGTEAAAAEDQ